MMMASAAQRYTTYALLAGQHLTNLVTSLGMFGMNAGAVVGPFLAVPLIETIGFRGALASWGAAFALVAVLGGLSFATTFECCRPQRRVRVVAARGARGGTAGAVGDGGELSTAC